MTFTGNQHCKRGRKAHRPNPNNGPIAAFAHSLLTLKESAGDPSYDRMRAEYGAMASKSALSAAARGSVLPTWETTWEFVRSLAVTGLGHDERLVRRRWRACWEAALMATRTEPEASSVRVADETPDGNVPARNASPAFVPGFRRRSLVTAASVAMATAMAVGVYLGRRPRR